MATLKSLISNYKSTVQSLEPKTLIGSAPQSQESAVDRRLKRIKELQCSTESTSKIRIQRKERRDEVEEENESLKREIEQIHRHNNKQCNMLIEEKNQMLNQLLNVRAESEQLQDAVQSYRHQMAAIQRSDVSVPINIDETGLGMRPDYNQYLIQKSKKREAQKQHANQITTAQQRISMLSNELLDHHQCGNDELRQLSKSSQFHVKSLLKELKLNQEIILKQEQTIQQLINDKAQTFKSLIAEKQTVCTLRRELDNANFKITKLSKKAEMS